MGFMIVLTMLITVWFSAVFSGEPESPVKGRVLTMLFNGCGNGEQQGPEIQVVS